MQYIAFGTVDRFSHGNGNQSISFQNLQELGLFNLSKTKIAFYFFANKMIFG